MKKIGVINPRQVGEVEITQYRLREAVRGIVFDTNDKIALLYVSRDAYYKLPGGGVEQGEDFKIALRRECLEEIGCEVSVLMPVGYTEEYWKEDGERQLSYCFTATVEGEKGNPVLTESEIDLGFKTLWVTVPEAIVLLRNCQPSHWEGDYIPARELLILQAYVDGVATSSV